jgi:hypothetical protein
MCLHSKFCAAETDTSLVTKLDISSAIDVRAYRGYPAAVRLRLCECFTLLASANSASRCKQRPHNSKRRPLYPDKYCPLSNRRDQQ